MLVDYHIHPGYSVDARPHGIDEYCRKAVSSGLEEICFTPHLEVDPERKHLDWLVRVNNSYHPMEKLEWLDAFMEEVNNAGLKYRGLVNVRAGIEIGYEPGQEEKIEKILQSYPFDFVLGSIHCLDHIAISSRKESGQYFQGKTAWDVCSDYYFLLDKAVNTGLFDCIAHLDLYRRYGKEYLGEEINTAHEGYAEPVLQNIAARNMALEINTSSLRRGLTQFHPSETLLDAAVASGIKFFTVGSDAHSIEELGHGIEDAVNLLQDYDLTPSTYKLRSPLEYNEAN